MFVHVYFLRAVNDEVSILICPTIYREQYNVGRKLSLNFIAIRFI